jgi:hypothetical protein
MSPIYFIVGILVISGCANSPDDLRKQNSSTRNFQLQLQGPLSDVAKCFTRNLDEIFSSRTIIAREKSERNLIEIQQRAHDELLILHDLTEMAGKTIIRSYLFPRDLTPGATREMIIMTASKCGHIELLP